MTIKELKKILKQAPDENKKVYIPHHGLQSSSIGYNFDDLNELDLYVIYEEAEKEFND